ncbi:glycerol dehydrogenase [Roseomonas sp. BN140053]|uniref:glycerol dehydrogenase n=1 Tax=Roseomonas sp. BN140053 TaxID=3391898 RepID=UPI0039ED7149
MIRSFMSTGLYVQGPGSFDLLGEKAAALGRRAAILCDAAMLDRLQPRIERSARAGSLAFTCHPVSGEVTPEAINALTEAAARDMAEVVVAIGGGRAIDTGKGVALLRGVPFVSVPTVASTDAPASRGIAIYDAQHVPLTVEQLPRNPDCVLVDTAIIAAAPPRFLRAGIGDALTKHYEVEACWTGRGHNKHGTRPLRTARLIARDCDAVVREQSVAALRAAEAGEVTEALEDVVEAVILLSCLAFENGGLSVAHSLARGLSSARGAGNALHGEQVAYATLVQMRADERPDAELAALRGFLREVGLPCSLAELGMHDPGPADIAALVASCLDSPHLRHHPRRLDAAAIEDAILGVEAAAAAHPVGASA